MEQTKHKTLPIEKTVEVSQLLGKKVLTVDGKKLGKVKSIHLHPTDMTVEGIRIDTGMFDVDHYIGTSYIKSLNEEGAILKITPASEIVGLEVFDSLGKNIGKVEKAKRANLTNKLVYIVVKTDQGEQNISADYIEAIGESVMLKEPFE